MKFKQAINKRTQHRLRAIELIFFFKKKHFNSLFGSCERQREIIKEIYLLSNPTYARQNRGLNYSVIKLKVKHIQIIFYGKKNTDYPVLAPSPESGRVNLALLGSSS